MKLRIGYLYGNIMNIYGDRGNIQTLVNRSNWRGIQTEVENISIGDKINPTDYDIYFWGGGQDKEQNLAAADLRGDKSKAIIEAVENGAALLSICGGYQLLGKYYKPADGDEIEGVGLFSAFTLASNKRMIGNLVIEINKSLNTSGTLTTLVGFENHSGKTYLEKEAEPLGRIVQGFGNNSEDRTEGCIYKNAIGCYLHGPVLPKNPHLADWLILKGLQHRDSEVEKLKPLDDTLETTTHQSIMEHLRKSK